MTRRTWTRTRSALLWLAGLALTVSTVYSHETHLYWGDTHLHTSWSSDAYPTGNVYADPDTSYCFAKGLPVLHPTIGNRVQLRRPLAFLAVSDHAVGFGTDAPVELGGRGLLTNLVHVPVTSDRCRGWYHHMDRVTESEDPFMKTPFQASALP